jgi:hypothetical protein
MKPILFLLLSCMSASTFSQRLSGYASLGLGSSIEDNIAGFNSQNRTRFIGSMAFYFRVNGRLSIGAEATGSGPLNILGQSDRAITDPSDNSLVLSPSNLKASGILLRNKVLLFSYKDWEPYIDIGVGINTYYYSDPVKDAVTIKKSSFVLSPEFGVNIHKFQFAVKMISSAKTPRFSGTEPEGSKAVSLQSIKAQQVYLTIGYQLFRL